MCTRTDHAGGASLFGPFDFDLIAHYFSSLDEDHLLLFE